MKSDYNIQKFKNFIILTSNVEGQLSQINESLRRYFISNKKKITQYAILSEFAYASDTFHFTTKSISDAIGISDKTLRTTMKELERSNLIYSFKFSTGQNTSKVYYVVNISTKKISKHIALALLCFYKPEVLPYTLISYNSSVTIKEEDLKIAIKYFLFYEEHIITDLKISDNSQIDLVLSIYNTLLEKRPNIFINSVTLSNNDFKAFFLEELPTT